MKGRAKHDDGRPLPEIPAVACRPGCRDCCRGPAITPSERDRLAARVSLAQGQFIPLANRRGFLMVSREDHRCPLLGPTGCTAYLERPIVCKLFGATSGAADLACPHGCGPAEGKKMLTADEAIRVVRAAGMNV